MACVQLLIELDAFYLEHRRCGELETGIGEGERQRIWMTWTCGGRIERTVPAEPAA